MSANMVSEARSAAKLVWFAGIMSTAAGVVYWARSRRESHWARATRMVRKFVTATQRELTPQLRAAAGAAAHGATEVTKAVVAGSKKIGARGQEVQQRTARLLANTPALMEGWCALWPYGRRHARADRR